MGSEFAYEDLASFELAKFEFNLLREESLQGEKCFVLEMTPTYEYSGYSKQIAWVDQQHYRVHRIEYYDRKGSLLKTLTQSAYQLYAEQYWRPLKMEMINHQTGKATLLTWENYQLKQGLDASEFTKNALKRAR